jgi:hypothetical protein
MKTAESTRDLVSKEQWQEEFSWFSRVLLEEVNYEGYSMCKNGEGLAGVVEDKIR